MPNGGPIEALQSVLQERKKVAKKTTEVETTLAQIRKNISASLVQQHLKKEGEDVEIKEDLMKEEQTYERLLQALRDMQVEIEERVRPVAEQVIEAEVDRLHDLSEHHKNALANCVSSIDQSILNCRAHMTEYHQMRADLDMLNERLSKLGAEPVPVPELLPADNVGDLIKARIDNLAVQGKI
jgi:chromosome segregation ATPase